MHQITVYFILAIVACICAFEAKAVPLGEDLQDESQREHIRVRRFTCDVLSFEAGGVKLNDSACGAHCVALGKRGGYCNQQKVCVCR